MLIHTSIIIKIIKLNKKKIADALSKSIGTKMMIIIVITRTRELKHLLIFMD
jgi:hypothetical protein